MSLTIERDYSNICNQIQDGSINETIKELVEPREKNRCDLVNIFYDMFDNKDKGGLHLITKMAVSQTDIELIKQAVLLRKNVNDVLKGVNDVVCFQRDNPDKVDFQAMLIEMSFAKFLWNKYKFVSRSMKNDFDIKSPEIASVFVNHKKEDFYIQYLNNKVDFDVKSQFLNNKYQYVNINQKSHKRYTDHNSDFYVVGLIDGDPNDFNTVKNIHFVLMTNDYFNKNQIAVNTSTNPRFTPYHKLDMKPFKDFLDIV